MALVNEGSHSFACQPHVYPCCPLFPSRRAEGSHYSRRTAMHP